MDTEEDTVVASYPRIIKRRPKWHKPVFYGCIIASVIFGIGLLLAPMMIRKRGPHFRGEATKNIRQIGFCLLEFDSDYGSYPSEATVALVSENHPFHGCDLSGSSSNALFRQFFAAELIQDERQFYARIPGVKRPDGIISPGNLLAPGECGFSYIAGLSYEGDPARPILLTPLIPGTTKFDPKPLEGFAVVLYPDNSVRSYKIAKDGHVYDKGIDILSPKNPIWKGKAPDIRYPDL